MEQLPSTYENKLIYVFRIEDKTHNGLLKIGETTVKSDLTIDKLYPCCKALNDAAKRRIDSYTNTAGVKYDLIYTELAIRQIKNNDDTYILDCFSDKDVHRVLVNSGYCYAKIPGTRATEWFKIDFDTAKKAITAVKEGKTNLLGTNLSTDDFSLIILRPEQEEAIQKTLHQFKSSNRMLWNAKMRFGKTLSALELVKRAGFNKTIIVTHRPVVDDSWRTDFNLIFTNGSVKYGSKKDIPNDKDINKLGDKFIYFASIQDLRGSSLVGGKFEKNSNIFDINWDLVIVDEAHEGTTTALGDVVIRNLVKEELNSKTKFLALSGTPFNIIDQYEDSGVYTWDYVMEQEAKAKWDINHFGDSNPYSSLPRLNIFTYDLGKLLNKDRYIELVDKAFNFTEFFRVRKKGSISEDAIVTENDELEFCHKEDILSFLNLITTSSNNSNYPYSSKEYRDLFKHTLWVVPGVKEAKALKELMLSHPVFGSTFFDIVNVAGNGDEENSNALEAVQAAIKHAGEDNYTITITCGKLTTGVTVPEWTAVFMLAGSYSTVASSYLQTIFRVQSPSSIGGKIKTNCYVFDFAPDRTLKMVTEAVSVSRKLEKRQESSRSKLGEFLNYCPVIAIEGSSMHYYNADKLMQQLKKVYVDRAVRTGFDDNSIYNDKLYKLTDADLSSFKNLKEIIGKTAANSNTKDIDINNQGFSDEEYEKLESYKHSKQLTPEEQAALARFKEVKKNRQTAISILRGISVRMPLLVYGANIKLEDDFKIEDFLDDEIVDRDSWEEFMPKGVDKELFKKFIKYYDKDIFIAATRKIRTIVKVADELEPEDRIKQITSLFSYFKNPDKETVLTPWRVVNLHLGMALGGYNFYDSSYNTILDNPRHIKKSESKENLLDSSYTRILEINSKTGLYPLYVTYSIYRSKLGKYSNNDLSKEQKQFLWIDTVLNNIFVICKTKMAKSITKRTLIGYKNEKINAHYFENLVNTLKTGKINNFVNKIKTNDYWNKGSTGIMNFDAVVGNPPYQEATKDTSDAPVYHLFMDASFKLSDVVSFITPARFLFNAGKTPKEWNKKILRDNHFKVVYYSAKSNDIFPNVSIKGGVVITLRNANIEYGCIGNFIVFKELKSILDKVLLTREDSIMNLVYAPESYKFTQQLYIENDFVKSRVSKGHLYDITTNIFEKIPELFYENKPNNTDYVGIYGRESNLRVLKWINKTYIAEHENLNYFKVFVPKSNGSGAIGEVLSTPVIGQPVLGQPFMGHTQTFISIGKFKTEFEAVSCLKYIKTKFARCLLGTLKVTQHNPKNTWKNVPLQDFTTQSDIDWSVSVHEIDLQLYNKYKLTKDEVKFIEQKVQPMEE